MESINGITREDNKGLFMLTNLNYESWAPKAMKYLLAYPGPWEWIKTGLEPTFNTPLLEILAEAPQRRVQPRESTKVGERGGGGELEDVDSWSWPRKRRRKNKMKKEKSRGIKQL
jgi:hypothetical protein